MRIRNQQHGSHRTSRNLGLVAAMAGLLAACTGTEERVTFVTTTQLGIDADGKTQSVDIGFTRMEGVAGPVYQTGAVPPVYADIHANASVFNPKISQTYATGDAAVIATSDQSTGQKYAFTGDRKVMFFGTATNVGLRLGFAPDPSISFGYKRQEFSTIPILKNTGGDVYGSVLAHLEVNVENSSYQTAGMGIGQFIATGLAAENLAPAVRSDFRDKAAKALKTVDCGVSNSPEAKNLQAAIKDSGKKAKLADWLKEQKLDISPTGFAYGDCYPALQAEAYNAISQ